MKPTHLLSLLVLFAVAPAITHASGSRTLRVQMYNSSAVAKSQCFVLGMKADSPYRKTITTFTHTQPNGKSVYTVEVPSQYVRVDVMCKANGPTAETTVDLNRFELDQTWVKANCPSSLPDAKCTVVQYGGDPE